MGKYIKTEMDYNMIYDFAKEIVKLDPDNPVLAKYLKMQNFEGAELRKVLKSIFRQNILSFRKGKALKR